MTLAILVSVSGALAAQETDKKKVMCTLPVLKSIAEELAGSEFEVTSLSKPDQDPHNVSPTPTLMIKVREAELFIELGLQLELWAEAVVRGSNNAKLAKGQPGRVVASAGIPRVEVPEIVSRSEGDVHPEGNPHLWMDPIRAKTIADNIAAGLKTIAPDKAAAIDDRLKKFKDRIDESLFGKDLLKEVGARTLTRKALDGSLNAYLEEKKLSDKLGGWLKKAAPLRGQKVIEFHKTWTYFAKLFGFEVVGSVQPKPGISPGPKDLEALLAKMKAMGVKLIIVDNFYPSAEPKALAEQTGAKVAIVPDQPGGEAGTEDYFKFIDTVLDRMLEGGK
jgi:ABC-type Zn uptake system ZnuABC Zn-binding protein ZnuA